jgi:hypothetical protein
VFLFCLFIKECFALPNLYRLFFLKVLIASQANTNPKKNKSNASSAKKTPTPTLLNKVHVKRASQVNIRIKMAVQPVKDAVLVVLVLEMGVKSAPLVGKDLSVI